MARASRDEQIKDIRGQQFDQKSLLLDLRGAIAGQPPIRKALLTLLLLCCCGLASVAVSVLCTTLGLEVFGLGQTFQESLILSVILILWLVTAIFQRWYSSLVVMFVGLGIAIALQGILGSLGLLDLVSYFFLSTAFVVLACWSIYAMTFCLVRWAIASLDILFLQPRFVKLLIPLVTALGAIVGSAMSSSPDLYQEGNIPPVTATQTLIARIVGITLTLALVIGGWLANQRRNTPWCYPDGFREWALALGSWAGTSFQNLDLSKVNFAGASLANTDLRGRSLYRTCFRNAQRLERARTDNRYLDFDNPKVQALLTTASSDDKNFSGLNLQGIDLHATDDLPPADLQDIDLTDANLTGADLRGANLSGAALIQTQLVNADLSGAQLTDACIQDWHINASTSFKGVTCRRVFLKRSPKGHFLDPNPNGVNFNPVNLKPGLLKFSAQLALASPAISIPKPLPLPSPRRRLTTTRLSYCRCRPSTSRAMVPLWPRLILPQSAYPISIKKKCIKH